MNFKELIIALSKINEQLREQSIRAVNTSLTFRNWFFGFYIVEFEQNGKDRAEYGKALLANIAAEMKAMAIPNSDERELRRYRQFYITYPATANLIAANNQIWELLPPELLMGSLKPIKLQIGSWQTPIWIFLIPIISTSSIVFLIPILLNLSV